MTNTLGRDSRVLEVFVEAMREELRRNDHKPDWKDDNVHEALEDLMYHCAKLAAAVTFANMTAIREYAADVANMAMIVGDTAGVLELPAADSPVLITNVFDVASKEPEKHDANSDDASQLTHDLGDMGRAFLHAVKTLCQSGPHWEEMTSGKIGPL